MGTFPGPPIDPGLQPERTRMAWSRTSLAFVANGGLLMHAGHAPGRLWLMAPGGLVIAVGALVYLTGLMRHRQVDRAVRAGEPAAGPVAIRATWAAMLLVCSLAGFVMLVRL